MKSLKLTSLTAAAVLLSSTAAFAVPVTLTIDGMRSSGGTHYSKIKSGASTWDWDAGTGILTQTGTLVSTQSVGPTPLLTDTTTGMVINTAANTTTATSYTCTEGTFLGGVGAHGCWNLNLGGDFALNSTAAYNVGGNADCLNVTIIPDDSSAGLARGLGNGAGGSCDPTSAAYGNWDVQTDNIAVGGILRLWNGVGDVNCLNNNAKNAACANQTYMTFQSTIPVPAAVWLFGSALGVMGVMRRKLAS